MEYEQMEKEIGRRSARIYVPLSLSAAVLFFGITTLIGDYPVVARLGGAIWVGLLSLIVSMPIVISNVKKRLRKE